MSGPNQQEQWGQFQALREQIGDPVTAGVNQMNEWGKGQLDATAQSWLDFKKNYPKLALTLSLLPGTGHAAAAVDLYDANQRGDGVDAAMAAAQFLPFGGVVKGMKATAQLSGAAAKVAAAKTVGAAAVQGGNVLDYLRAGN